MRTLRNKLITFAAAGILAVVGTVMSSHEANAQNQGNVTSMKIVNPLPIPITANTPLPVSVVPPAQAATVTCKITVGRGSSSSPFEVTGGKGTALLVCPQGVSSIDVRRVIYDADALASGSGSTNAAGYRLLLGISDQYLGVDPSPTLIALLTEGAPEKALSDPILINLNQSVSYSVSCFSGIAGLNTTCGGAVFLIGTPH
jgi:hypothetical protein